MNQIAWNYFIWESFHGNKNLGRRWLLDFMEKGKNMIERVAPCKLIPWKVNTIKCL